MKEMFEIDAITLPIMANGRKERIVISCVTFETVKISDPVKYYDATRAHLIHYIREGLDESRTRIYREFFDKVCDNIRKSGRDVEIIEHNEVVSDFSKMLKTILSIIDSEQNKGECDIYVNISAGSSEYAAAATIASMMSKGVIPFSVGTKSFTISDEEDIKRTYYVNDVPVGLTSSTREPKVLPVYVIERPQEHLVRGLRVLKEEIAKKHSTSSAKMAPLLIGNGIWVRDGKVTAGRENQSYALNYHRDFMKKWLELGWVEKDELRKKDIITKKGQNVIDTFYLD